MPRQWLNLCKCLGDQGEGMFMSETCRECGGKGYLVDALGGHERCPDCGGTGIEGQGGIHVSGAESAEPHDAGSSS